MSEIGYNSAGDAVSFVGPDAVELFRVAALASGLRLLKVGIKPRRGWTITKALGAAGQVTGKKYRRTQIQAAIDDLHVWVQTMKAALPAVEVGG